MKATVTIEVLLPDDLRDGEIDRLKDAARRTLQRHVWLKAGEDKPRLTTPRVTAIEVQQ